MYAREFVISQVKKLLPSLKGMLVSGAFALATLLLTPGGAALLKTAGLLLAAVPVGLDLRAFAIKMWDEIR